MMNMMMLSSSEALQARWNGLVATEGKAYIRVDAIHPLEFYIGYEEIGEKTLLLVSPIEPSTMPSSMSIVWSAGKRGDGKWALMWRLIRTEQEPVFVRLCHDLIESSRAQFDDREGLRHVLSRYRLWHRLMELQGSGLLSEIEQKGLLGEILYLQRILVDKVPALDALTGWVGPANQDRDYLLADGWHEIKTVDVGARTITISSLEQLDAPFPGEIVVYVLDKTTADDLNSFSLRGTVDRVKMMLVPCNSAVEAFESKLLQAGYMDLKEYGEQHYRLNRVCHYCLDDRFPCLTRAKVPTQVLSVKYELSMSSLERWRVPG